MIFSFQNLLSIIPYFALNKISEIDLKVRNFIVEWVSVLQYYSVYEWWVR